MTETENEQYEKSLHLQAEEILGHIRSRDYGRAESKAVLLLRKLAEGDWTLGGGNNGRNIS